MAKEIHDITDQVKFSSIDGECMPLLKCACGKTWDDWDFILGDDEDHPSKCFNCGRWLFFRAHVKVYEVKGYDER